MRTVLSESSRTLHPSPPGAIVLNGRGAIRDALLRAQETLSASRFEQSAFTGWLYAGVIDRDFIDAGLPDEHRPACSKDGSHGCQFSPAQQVARDALATRDLYEHLQSLVCDENLSRDSFCQLESVFSPKVLNILVIGAGCTGLVAANSLQKALGERVRILVLENRIVQPHQKRPYARDWMTFIRLDVLHDLIDDRVFQLLARVGDQGYMGAPLNLFETLLLESCNELGVQFLFDKVDGCIWAACRWNESDSIRRQAWRPSRMPWRSESSRRRAKSKPYWMRRCSRIVISLPFTQTV